MVVRFLGFLFELTDIDLLAVPLRIVYDIFESFIFLVAADDILDAFDDLRKGVYLIGNGYFEPFLNLPLELPDFFLVLPLYFAVGVAVLRNRPHSAVEEGELLFGVALQVGEEVFGLQFELLHGLFMIDINYTAKLHAEQPLLHHQGLHRHHP